MRVHFQPPPPPPQATQVQPKALPTRFEVEQKTEELIDKAKVERDKRDKRRKKKAVQEVPRHGPSVTPEILAVLITMQEAGQDSLA